MTDALIELIKQLRKLGGDAMENITHDEGGWGHGNACDINELVTTAADRLEAMQKALETIAEYDCMNPWSHAQYTLDTLLEQKP